MINRFLAVQKVRTPNSHIVKGSTIFKKKKKKSNTEEPNVRIFLREYSTEQKNWLSRLPGFKVGVCSRNGIQEGKQCK